MDAVLVGASGRKQEHHLILMASSHTEEESRFQGT